MSRDLDIWIIGIVYIAIIYILVRPHSPGPALIAAVSKAAASLVNAATGGGSMPSGSSTVATTVQVVTGAVA